MGASSTRDVMIRRLMDGVYFDSEHTTLPGQLQDRFLRLIWSHGEYVITVSEQGPHGRRLLCVYRRVDICVQCYYHNVHKYARLGISVGPKGKQMSLYTDHNNLKMIERIAGVLNSLDPTRDPYLDAE